MRTSFLDYERYDFANRNGEYFLSDFRSASREFKRGGETEIQLEYGGITVIGTTLQYEKAEDVCRLWVEDGLISINFHKVSWSDEMDALLLKSNDLLFIKIE